ncbi:MAG: UTP--glucose-1-phosphate uridylyltransferase GalU [Dongiaceae bacterium]
MKQRVRKAIFPVGGLGVRFLPATKAVPKEMLPVVDKPLIQYAVEEARAAGIEDFIFVTGRGKSAIEDHFDRAPELERELADRGKEKQRAELAALDYEPGRITYVRQREPLGLGHAVWCAHALAGDEPVAVLLPDDLILAEPGCLKQMIDAHERVGGNMIAVMEVAQEHTNRYGVLSPGKEDGRLVEVRGLIEKPDPARAPSRLAVIGRYILQPRVFALLARHQRGAGNEIQLTDALAGMIGEAPFHGYRFEGTRYDCGDKAGFVEANIAYALRHPEIGARIGAVIGRLSID